MSASTLDPAVAELLADTVPMLDPTAAAAVEAAKAKVELLQREKLGELLPGAVEQLRGRVTGKELPIQLPNWPRLAQALGGGLWPGCHILTGGTGTGKSQLALQLALQAARAGIPTRYVALELDSLGLVARLLCMAAGDKAGLWWSQLYNGQGVQSEQRLNQLVQAYAGELAGLPLYLATDQGPHGWSYDSIEPAVELLRAAHPEADGRPVLLVVDFLQLLTSPEGKREELRETIGRAAYAARHAARKHGAAVLMLSSAARAQYTALSVDLSLHGSPEIHHAELVGAGKESGDIEYAADTAMVLARNNENKGEVWLAVAKQRAGRGGWFRLVEQNGWLFEGDENGQPGAKALAAKEKKAAKAASGGIMQELKAAAIPSGRDKAAKSYDND